ncbi:MAG: hypothetical protein ACR652_00435 [Methylocystis sp.]|uniref:hypothetical protein n=1 Tax=Methylocystis sp. TaxID=1911079 RepID=UPI003DA3A7E0
MVQYEGVAIYGALYQHFRPLWIAMAAMGAPAYVKPDFLAAVPSPTTTTFSDATTFSDGTLLAQSTGDCSLSAAAARGARTISVTNSVSRPRAVGDWFEIDGRAHLIQAIDGSNWTIWPTLRANYASGAVLEIDDPRVLAYLTADSRANAMPIEARQLTLMSLEFIEVGW